MNLASVQILSESLKSSCNIGVMMLVPLLFVLILSAMKKPTIPVFAGGLVIGCIWAVLFQNIPLTDVIGSAVGGFKSATGNADIDKLLSRGGALSMAETIFLCIGAGMFSGVFERTGVLSRLMDQLRKIVKISRRSGILRYLNRYRADVRRRRTILYTQPPGNCLQGCI